MCGVSWPSDEHGMYDATVYILEAEVCGAVSTMTWQTDAGSQIPYGSVAIAGKVANQWRGTVYRTRLYAVLATAYIHS